MSSSKFVKIIKTFVIALISQCILYLLHIIIHKNITDDDAQSYISFILIAVETIVISSTLKINPQYWVVSSPVLFPFMYFADTDGRFLNIAISKGGGGGIFGISSADYCWWAIIFIALMQFVVSFITRCIQKVIKFNNSKNKNNPNNHDV